MRIISKFHDYYDSVQMYGQDQSLIYIRKVEEYKGPVDVDGIPSINNTSNYVWYTSKDEYSLQYSNFLVFIGQDVFPGIKLTKRVKNKEYMVADVVMEEFAYSIDAVEKFLNKYASENELERYNAIPKQYKSFRHNNSSFCKSDLTLFFSLKPTRNLCLEIRCPVVYQGSVDLLKTIPVDKVSSRIIMNPCLKDIAFMKCIDAGLTFQKIESFISGVLPGRYPEMIQIDEGTRLEKRGFDKKWSFRKMPWKKK